ncbi:hypothetical protein E0Z10_g9799 [Xylaria hypoxylon]|uniref:Uncharacterized protein n=1 Tax=Xylaria hypoxylon TaxID=37992 RepID=A0A4Z0Y7N3_9PEZI|nr:hypothetical protein E0Z10_g9799 [Xylaria hypoxylon]
MRNQFSSTPKYAISAVTFDDCDGSPALSIYRGVVPTTPAIEGSSAAAVLPPLFSFQVYVTYKVDLVSKRENLAQRFSNIALEEFQDSDLVRFDIYFRPNATNTQILQHYGSEKRALKSYATHADGFCGFTIVITSETWEENGVHLLFHDPPAQHLSSSEREAILGDGTNEEGVLLVYKPIRQASIGSSLSLDLRGLAYNTEDWADFDERYRAAIKEGRVQW